MERTRSGAGNANENRNQPPVIERVAVIAAAPEPITMADVQMMIQTMLDRSWKKRDVCLGRIMKNCQFKWKSPK